MNLGSKQQFLLLTNSYATTQLSPTPTSDTVLLVINVPLTLTFSKLSYTTGRRILVMFYITVLGVSTRFYYKLIGFILKYFKVQVYGEKGRVTKSCQKTYIMSKLFYNVRKKPQ